MSAGFLALLLLSDPVDAPAPAVTVVDDVPAASDDEPAASDDEPAATEPDVAAVAPVAPAPEVDAAVADEPEPHLGLRLAAGLGTMLRAFDPGPATLTRYRSTPVGAVRFELAIAPTPSTELALTADRSLGMSTTIQDQSAATESSRWEVAAALHGHVGAIGLAPVVGVGRRRFSIESTSPLRSPDGDYAYLSVGGRLDAPLGARAAVRLTAAFEPVYGGDEPTAMTLGPARRWGMFVGGALAVRASRHLAATLAVDYQRFAWSWPTAGGRGAGGAIDQYPSAIVSLAADY